MKRPPTIAVPAIMFFVFEGFAILGVIYRLISMFGKTAGMNNPTLAMMNASPEFALYSKIMMPVSLILAVLGIATARGLLKGQEAARKRGIWLAVVKGLIVIVGTAVTLTFIGPQMTNLLTHNFDKIEVSKDSTVVYTAISVTFYGSLILGGVFGVVVSAVIAALLTKSSAVVYCRGGAVVAAPPPLPLI